MNTETDGRRARREQNVQAVAHAVLELLREGHVQVGAADIAERSGVSLRSVFRYFEDLQALQVAALELQHERVDHLYQPLPAHGSFADRVDRFVTHRLALHEEIRFVVRAAKLRELLDPVVAEEFDSRRAQLRTQVSQLFAPELQEIDEAIRTDVIDALECATAFESLEYLRNRRNGTDGLHQVMSRTIRALLDAPHT